MILFDSLSRIFNTIKMNTRNTRSRPSSAQGNTLANTSTQGTSSTSSAQGTAANPTGQTGDGNAATQETITSTSGASEANTSTTPTLVRSPPPMTVHNVPPMTFHENGEKLFMDDKHLDATHPSHVQITRTQVEDLYQQFRQHSATWPGVPIAFQQYFSPSA